MRSKLLFCALVWLSINSRDPFHAFNQQQVGCVDLLGICKQGDHRIAILRDACHDATPVGINETFANVCVIAITDTTVQIRNHGTGAITKLKFE